MKMKGVIKMYFIESKVAGVIDGESEKENLYYYRIAGDSSETKPTDNVADGSTFTETDTGDVYMFNAKSAAWVKMFGLKS